MTFFGDYFVKIVNISAWRIYMLYEPMDKNAILIPLF